MINTFNECLTYARYLESEHKKIRRMVRSAQDAFCGIVRGEGGASDQMVSMLMQKLSGLRDQLDRHFSEEEQGGCMEEAASRKPSLAPLVDDLEAQHGYLLGQLDHVIELLDQDGQIGSDVAEVAPLFDEFAMSLGQHESDESRLLQQGLNISSDDVP